jgi:uncharacterized membrane protein HdeD (DUF308 family)
MSFAPVALLDDHVSGQPAAAARVNAPGILLIIVGVLNLLSAVLTVFVFLSNAFVPLDEFAKRQEMSQDFMKKVFPKMAEDIEKQGKPDPQALKSQTLMTYGIWSLLLLVAGIIPIIAGFRMRNLRGYGLAIAGSILALFPCISGGCCLIIGPVAGIWSLVVLCNAEVKGAFR